MGSLCRQDLREELHAFAESSFRSILIELRGWVKEDLQAEIQAWAGPMTTQRSTSLVQGDTNNKSVTLAVSKQKSKEYAELGNLVWKQPALNRTFTINTDATFGRPLSGTRGSLMKLDKRRQSKEYDDYSPMDDSSKRQLDLFATSSWGVSSQRNSAGTSAGNIATKPARICTSGNVRFDATGSSEETRSLTKNKSAGHVSFSRVPRAESLLDDDIDADTQEAVALLETGRPQSSNLKKVVTVSTYKRLSALKSPESQGPCVQFCEMLVTHPYFETIVGLLVLLNACIIGLGIDAAAKNVTNPWVEAAEPFFATIFTLEIVARMLVAGMKDYFCGDQWHWNLFDVVMVCLQLFDTGSSLMATILHHLKEKSSLGIFRMLRILRLIRVTRLIRLVHLFADLKSMVTSMVNSVGALFWAMVLQFMIIYMFSVLCMAIILESERPMDDHLNYYFGSMPRTSLTLFECVVGGVNWDDVVMLLVLKISPYMGLIFCMYLTFSFFAMTNLVTGVFVDKAMQMTREDKDTYLANRISHLFFVNTGDDDAEEVTWETFQQKLSSEAMQEYFKVLNLDVAEARGLFDLLDVDSSGSVSNYEVVTGCLRLRGPAKALDLALLAQDTSRIEEMMQELCNYLEYRSPAG